MELTANANALEFKIKVVTFHYNWRIVALLMMQESKFAWCRLKQKHLDRFFRTKSKEDLFSVTHSLAVLH